MPYKIAIRKNETGEVRIVEQGLHWGDGSLYWWTHGNFACDCNRDDVFRRDGEDEDDSCGNTRFSVLYAELEDGTKIPIDERFRPEARRSPRFLKRNPRKVI
jgi:hypothetical protein